MDSAEQNWDSILELQDESYLSHKTEYCSVASWQGEASRRSETPELVFHYGGERMWLGVTGNHGDRMWQCTGSMAQHANAGHRRPWCSFDVRRAWEAGAKSMYSVFGKFCMISTILSSNILKTSTIIQDRQTEFNAFSQYTGVPFCQWKGNRLSGHFQSV